MAKQSKKGLGQIRGNVRQRKKALKRLEDAAKKDTYLRYKLEIEKQKYNINPFSRAGFNTAVGTTEGRHDTSPEYIAKRQFQGGHTDSEISTRRKALEKRDGITFTSDRDFVEKGGVGAIDQWIAEIQEANPHLSPTELALLVTRTIFSPN